MNNYNKKKQLDFLNNFFFFFVIYSVYDVNTEIKSIDLTKFEEMTSRIDDMKKLFKISVMNLGRSDYKITKTNAIPVLKHLCIQARIPFDITKYSKYYTFSLTYPNELVYPRNNNNKECLINMNINDNNTNAKNLKSLSFLDKLQYPAIDGKYNLIAPYLDVPYLFQHCIEKIMKDNRLSINCIGILSGKISEWVEIKNKKTVNIRLQRVCDVYNRILYVKLYDKAGKNFYTSDKADITLNKVTTLLSNVSDINCPIFSLPFSDLYLTFPYENSKPHYYMIEMECGVICDKCRIQDYQLWEPLKFKNMQSNKIHIESDKIIIIPHSEKSFIITKCDACTVYIGDAEINFNKGDVIPLPVYNNVIIHAKNVWFKYADKNSDEIFLIGNKKYTIKNGSLYPIIEEI